MGMVFKLQEDILNWADKKGLLKPENTPKQIIKLQEEVGELAGAYLKKKTEEMCDAIGDIQIVMIILCQQLEIDYLECLNGAYEVIKDRTGNTVNGIFIKD